ncbi:hypothetical protein [Aliidiomarina maris]|uniref:Uncharacterized protein n=1 Tax=Aliidiomarina maris TaxID=531312 RepID=A0A327X6P4_9GAMM|nr:hypothetical protein [Aliidiomarina maris]RAK01858.1 hypothetical protein B0I24_101497 [Aliidiomarina maris]RUO28667.1 hypothetical protein CWE07_02415 [Aliidiomarina maris]
MNNFGKKLLVLALPAFVCSQAYATDIEADVEVQAVPPQVVTFIAAQAKSFLISQASSFLREQIFGGSNGPQVALLHQDSLDEIRAIVNSGFEQHRLITMQAEFNAYSDMVHVAHQIAANDDYDAGYISNLITHGFSLVNNSTYSAQGYDYYFTLTGSRAMAYSLMLSVMTERALKQSGYTRANVAQFANEWASNLTTMGAAADSYVMQNVTIQYMSPSCSGTIIHSEPPSHEPEFSTTNLNGRCENIVTDSIGNRQERIMANLWGYEGAHSRASEIVNQWRSEYRVKFKGAEFNQFVAELENFGN